MFGSVVRGSRMNAFALSTIVCLCTLVMCAMVVAIVFLGLALSFLGAGGTVGAGGAGGAGAAATGRVSGSCVR